jgi:hypothetical protein
MSTSTTMSSSTPQVDLVPDQFEAITLDGDFFPFALSTTFESLVSTKGVLDLLWRIQPRRGL